MQKIVNISIFDIEIDAIVNAANSFLSGGGGVDGAIHAAAGPELYDACSKIGHCDVGKAVITPGFNLKAKYIIHTVGPFYNHYDKETNEMLLADCYRNSLNLAKKNGIKSIAFPCLSTGAYGYPLEEAAPIAIKTVSNWLKKNNDEMSVYLVCYTDREYEIYKGVYDELYRK